MCTHVKAVVSNKMQNTTKMFIVPLIVQSVQLVQGKINKSNQVELQKKKFIFSTDKKIFNRYLTQSKTQSAFISKTKALKPT